MFNIDEFREIASARGGHQFHNKFDVLIPCPAGLLATNTQSNIDAQELKFWVSNAPVPGVSMKLHPVLRYGYGVVENKPMAPVFSTIALNVMADAEGINWRFFKEWLNFISSFDLSNGMSSTGTTWEIPYKAEYAVDMRVRTYDLHSNVIQSIIYRDAFPFTLPNIDFDWGSKDKVVTFPVHFSFFDWYEETDVQ